jgi:preprotein translocase subunit SecG
MYNFVLIVAVIVAVFFTVLILLTAKGDAMSGGGGAIRTTYKGKASIDDQISKMTMYMGVGFMALMILLDIINSRVSK